MTQFYTTVDSVSLRPYMPATPIMLTATSYWSLDRNPDHIRPAKVPDHVPEVAADSGGFVAAHRYGHYPFTFDAYTSWLATIPRLSWAALPDLPVERELAQTYANMRERQELTLRWARELWGEGTDYYEYNRVPWTWVATIQGRTIDDYVWMAEQLKPLLVDQQTSFEYTAYAEDRYFFGEPTDEDNERYALAEQGAEHWRIGIGSLCRRTQTIEIVNIVRALSEILPHTRFHLWGVKLSAIAALAQAGLLPVIASLDSAAWNQRFGDRIEEQKRSPLSQREYAWTVAWPDYHARMEHALAGEPPEFYQGSFLALEATASLTATAAVQGAAAI